MKRVWAVFRRPPRACGDWAVFLWVTKLLLLGIIWPSRALGIVSCPRKGKPQSNVGSGMLRQGEKGMTKKLYVGNLSYHTTEATLSDLFGTIGEVVSVNLIIDRMTGRSRGFAFVEMAEESAAQQAINDLNGKAVDGRDIKVAEARPQRSRGSGDSWGRGGRGRY